VSGAAGVPATSPAKSGLPRLVDLGSTTCIPCKKMAPILEELKVEFRGRVDVEFIDVTKNAQAADEYQINVIPTQVFFDKDGKEVFRHEGFYPKADTLAQFEKMGIKTK
jgi:thioredoxin 1